MFVLHNLLQFHVLRNSIPFPFTSHSDFEFDSIQLSTRHDVALLHTSNRRHINTFQVKFEKRIRKQISCFCSTFKLDCLSVSHFDFHFVFCRCGLLDERTERNECAAPLLNVLAMEELVDQFIITTSFFDGISRQFE